MGGAVGSEHIPLELRRATGARAGHTCEYCHLSQAGQEARFHIDHVVPRSRRGRTGLDNLALSCVSCSLRKAARIAAVDPANGQEAALFSPRTMAWARHFRWDGVVLTGLTPTGRATVVALAMNRPLILTIRQEEEAWGQHPE